MLCFCLCPAPASILDIFSSQYFALDTILFGKNVMVSSVGMGWAKTIILRGTQCSYDIEGMTKLNNDSERLFMYSIYLFIESIQFVCTIFYE